MLFLWFPVIFPWFPVAPASKFQPGQSSQPGRQMRCLCGSISETVSGTGTTKALAKSHQSSWQSLPSSPDIGWWYPPSIWIKNPSIWVKPF